MKTNKQANQSGCALAMSAWSGHAGMSNVNRNGCANEYHVQRTYVAGLQAARQKHVIIPNHEACAAEFAEHMLDTHRWWLWEATQFSEPWLRACAANFARTYQTRDALAHSRCRPLDTAGRDAATDQSGIAPLERHVGQIADRQALDAAIAKLPSRQCRLVKLHFFTGWNVSEIAVAEGISAKAAGMVISRGLHGLRAYLDAAGFDASDALRYLDSPPA